MLGYDQSHFCPLVRASEDEPDKFPLVNIDGEMLPIRFGHDLNDAKLSLEQYMEISYENEVPYIMLKNKTSSPTISSNNKTGNDTENPENTSKFDFHKFSMITLIWFFSYI